jgi:hypothetical protein
MTLNVVTLPINTALTPFPFIGGSQRDYTALGMM